ncbi:hypothetical protein [Cellulomonas sp. KH9]|uniref:hypothetical protein n=1 Tax=Cellulomonas sp. KH9 TaxID=1855324 RepID=UPI0008E6336E|nr:hypothetical protein [Cellulomonas sp. KH9]SFK01300.1 hypothetical protein SAMN05216467_1697 [Cellulomonas sp. KH9]
MPAYGGDVTADLRALLLTHCPDLADEVMAAYGVASAAATPPGDDGTGPRWSHLTLGQVPGVQQVAEIAAAPLEAVAAALKVVAGLLDVLTAFLLELPDPVRAMIQAAYEILKQVVDDILSSGCYLYTDVPGVTSWQQRVDALGETASRPRTWKAGDHRAPAPVVGAFEGWSATFRRSFDDPGDGDRPIFSDGATVEAVFVMATAPGMANLVPLLNGLGALVDDRALTDALTAFRDADLPGFEDWLHPDPDDWRVRGEQTGPGWRSWKLRDIAPPSYPLRELERVPELLKAILENIDSVVGLLKKLIEAVRSKIDVLLQIAETIQRIVDMIRSLTASGLHVLAVVTHDGVDGLVQAFLDAQDRPGRDAQGKPVRGLVIGGACLLSGTSTATYLAGPALIWKLLGVDGPLDDARAALEKDVVAHRDRLLAAGAPVEQAWQRMRDGVAEHGAAFVAEERDALDRLVGAVTTVGPALGRTPAEVAEAVRTARGDVMGQVEQLAAAGAVLDPFVLAELEATRVARSRGRRALADGQADA